MSLSVLDTDSTMRSMGANSIRALAFNTEAQEAEYTYATVILADNDSLQKELKHTVDRAGPYTGSG